MLATNEIENTALASGEALEVPAGALLARADVRRLKALLQSLLVFRRDDDLGAGQMKVEEDPSTDAPCFNVRIAAERRSRQRS